MAKTVIWVSARNALLSTVKPNSAHAAKPQCVPQSFAELLYLNATIFARKLWTVDISVRNLAITDSANVMRRPLSLAGARRSRLGLFVEGKHSVLISVKRSCHVGTLVVFSVIRNRVNRLISIIPAENYVKNQEPIATIHVLSIAIPLKSVKSSHVKLKFLSNVSVVIVKLRFYAE